MKILLTLLLLIPSLSWSEIKLDCKVPNSIEITDKWQIKPSRYYELIISDDIQNVTNQFGDIFIRTNVQKDINWEKDKGVYIFHHHNDSDLRLQISRENFDMGLQYLKKPWAITPYNCKKIEYLF